MLRWKRRKFRARQHTCNAWIVDPEAMKVESLHFDGNENHIPKLLGYEQISKEKYGVAQVYFGAETVENENLYGFVIEHSGGIVNHGRCLVVDCIPAITYRFIPGYGAETWTPFRSTAEQLLVNLKGVSVTRAKP